MAHEQKAKQGYSSIGTIWCPPLNDYVAFNTMGFHHLIRKKGALRTEDERANRFRLLPYVASIIADPKTLFTLENGKSFSHAKFWICKRQVNGETITVVIRKIGNGQKHFFSVFSDNKIKDPS